MPARLSSVLPLSILWCLVVWVAVPVAQAAPPRTVLLVGDSLSAAHNIEVGTSWPALLQKRLADMRPPRVLVNASISGETTASAVARLPALLKRYRPGIVILELGGNDGLRGLPLSEIRTNLSQMVEEAQDSGARVLLLGIELPINYGPQYRTGLREIYAGLARAGRVPLVPFLLDGIALDPRLMQPDGLHPTAAAQPRVLANIWPVLAPMLTTGQ
ncbi:MAG TPA: arylesterase [Rhodanobacteraceae bacterium]|nr:arylesterase [Rhodanobacteraceae bacterium]